MTQRVLKSVAVAQNEIRAHELKPPRSRDHPLRKAHLILRYAHDSANAFLDTFDKMRKARGARHGATTDEEQDHLRAMLVMAAAGLDSMLKQIIRDALMTLVQVDDDVRDGLDKFVSRQIRGDTRDAEGLIGHRFLARVFIAESQRDQVIEEYVRHLTGISLQSVAEVKRTASAIGIRYDVIGFADLELKRVFDIRNRIIHEFDIDFAAQRRNRKSRTRKMMIGFTNTLLAVAENILTAADQKLASWRMSSDR